MAQLTGSTVTTVTAYSLANGQFDWSKSDGMTIGNTANTDFVYGINIIKIPNSSPITAKTKSV